MGCSGPWTFGQNQEVQGAKTSHAQDGEAPDLTTRIRYDQHALEKTTLRPMSNTKPVVLKGWALRLGEYDKCPLVVDELPPPDPDSDLIADACTLVIGEEAIPKSEVEKMLREIVGPNPSDEDGTWATTISRIIAIAKKYDLSPKSNTQQTEPGS